MDEQERQEFIKKETKAIYEEFDAYLNQMIILKPFLKNLADVANGANSGYNLSETVKNN